MESLFNKADLKYEQPHFSKNLHDHRISRTRKIEQNKLFIKVLPIHNDFCYIRLPSTCESQAVIAWRISIWQVHWREIEFNSANNSSLSDRKRYDVLSDRQETTAREHLLVPFLYRIGILSKDVQRTWRNSVYQTYILYNFSWKEFCMEFCSFNVRNFDIFHARFYLEEQLLEFEQALTS